VLVVEPFLTDIVAVAAHPARPEFAVLGACGTVQRCADLC
jgi:hypothetical protein